MIQCFSSSSVHVISISLSHSHLSLQTHFIYAARKTTEAVRSDWHIEYSYIWFHRCVCVAGRRGIKVLFYSPYTSMLGHVHVPYLSATLKILGVKKYIRSACRVAGDSIGGRGNNSSGRRLPQIPRSPRASLASGLVRESGWAQVGVAVEDGNLLVTLWAAEGLRSVTHILTLCSQLTPPQNDNLRNGILKPNASCRMVETANEVSLPRPYAIVRLCTFGWGTFIAIDLIVPECCVQCPMHFSTL